MSCVKLNGIHKIDFYIKDVDCEALLDSKIEGLKHQKPVGSIKARPKLREWFQSTKTLCYTTLDTAL